jgi:hypothetical protein
VVGPFLGMACMVPIPFAARGNRSYLEFWVMIGGPRYPGYITLIDSKGYLKLNKGLDFLKDRNLDIGSKI